MNMDDMLVEPKFYFNDKPLLVVKSSDIKETTSFSLEEEPVTVEPNIDFLKPFSFSCEATVKKKDEKKFCKLFYGKKHRLPRKIKKALRGIAGITPQGEWIVRIDKLRDIEIKTKWEYKAYRLAALQIVIRAYDEIFDDFGEIAKEANELDKVIEETLKDNEHP